MRNQPEPSNVRDRVPAHPVFIGGTGRSGTTITGRLLASHRNYAGLPFELRLHIGTALVARGARSVEWLRNEAMNRYESHFHHVFDLEAFTELLDSYARDVAAGGTADAARNLIEGFMGSVAEMQGKPFWVEMTPLNAMWGSWLHNVFPDMRMINMLRDGRDTAVSVSRSWGGTMELSEAIAWWRQRIEQIDRNLKKLPDNAALTVEFERLARDDRDGAFSQIIDFLSIDEDPAMRRFFEHELVADRSNIGRWRRDLTPEEQELLTEQYQEIVGTLRERGIAWLPPATAEQPFG